MKIQDALNVTPQQINSMTERELRAYARTLFDTANKRISRVNDSGVYSPSVNYLKSQKGIEKFTSPETMGQLRQTVAAAREFLSKESSTVKGSRAIDTRVRARIGADKNTDLRGFWQGYRRFTEEYPELLYKEGSDRIIKDLYQMYDGNDIDGEDLLTAAEEYAESEYYDI